MRVARAKAAGRLAAHARSATCRARRCSPPTPPWRSTSASSASPPTAAKPRTHARRALRQRHEVLTGGGGASSTSGRDGAVARPRSTSASSPRRRSATTSPPASRRQGRRLRHPGPRRALRARDPRQLFRRDGAAAVRDRAAAATRSGPRVSEEILINVTPQETRVAVISAGVVQELLVERAASRGLVGNIYMGRVARVLPGMQSAFVEIGLERAAFLHVADIWEQRNANGEAGQADREDPRRGPDAAGAGGQGPDRHQGRAPVDAGLDRRAPAGLPAAGPAHRHLAEDRGRRRPRSALREKLQALLPADEKGGFIVRTVAESATDDELRADIEYLRHLWERHPRALARAPAPPQLLYQDLSLAQRVLRDIVTDGHGARDGRLARELPEARRLRRDLHAQRARRARALHRRAAAVRPVRRRGRDREGAGAPRGPEVRRLR